MKKGYVRAGLVIFWVILIVGAVLTKPEKRQKESVYRMPDAVSLYAVNDKYYLNVIADRRDMKDEEALKNMLEEMCRKNAFHSIKFSEDAVLKKLHISVYTKREEIGEGDADCVFEIAAD